MTSRTQIRFYSRHKASCISQSLLSNLAIHFGHLTIVVSLAAVEGQMQCPGKFAREQAGLYEFSVK